MQERTKRYSDADKIAIIADYLRSGLSMEAYQSKRGMGHSTLSRWLIRFGLPNASPKETDMKKPGIKQNGKSQRELQLEAKVAELEKQLEQVRLKALAYETMVDVAKEELGIDLRKKSGAKQ